MLRGFDTSHCVIIDFFHLAIRFETNFYCTFILLRICLLILSLIRFYS